MTMQQIITLATGLTYLVAAGVSVPAVRLLGRTYRTQITAHPAIIGFGLFYMVMLWWRAVTLLFPGELVETGKISIVAPAFALAILGLNVLILDHILRLRAPPPLVERILRIAARHNMPDRAMAEMAFAMPAATIGEQPMEDDEERQCPRTRRLIVMTAATLLAMAVVAIVLSSSVATS